MPVRPNLDGWLVCWTGPAETEAEIYCLASRVKDQQFVYVYRERADRADRDWTPRIHDTAIIV